jgi:hypothetical protein
LKEPNNRGTEFETSDEDHYNTNFSRCVKNHIFRRLTPSTPAPGVTTRRTRAQAAATSEMITLEGTCNTFTRICSQDSHQIFGSDEYDKDQI